jgi:hypothetical protein
MAINKISNKERRAAGNIYCDHCKPEKVDAVWRLYGNGARHDRGDFACDKHMHLIKDNEGSDNLTEADQQTWMHL